MLPLGAAETDSAYHEAVSLLRIIVDPGAYEGMSIIATGFFDFGVHPTLYLNHLSAETGDFSAGIKVRDDTEDGEIVAACAGMYVSVWRRVVPAASGFEMTEVIQFVDAKSGEACWPPKID